MVEKGTPQSGVTSWVRLSLRDGGKTQLVLALGALVPSPSQNQNFYGSAVPSFHLPEKKPDTLQVCCVKDKERQAAQVASFR